MNSYKLLHSDSANDCELCHLKSFCKDSKSDDIIDTNQSIDYLTDLTIDCLAYGNGYHIELINE